MINLVKISIIGVIILVIILLSVQTYDFQDDIAPQDILADVIMPTKASRPVCEETDSCYIPSKLTIKIGNSVTWINNDSAFHSVTSGSYDSPTNDFDSGYLDPYQTFTLTFEQVGIIDYYCTLHPWMYGQVIVES